MSKLIKIIKVKILGFIYSYLLLFLFRNIKSYKVLFGELKGYTLYSSVVFNQIFGGYEKNVENFLKKELNKNAVVIDIGAYNGYTGFLCDKILQSKGSLNHMVFLVEANKSLFDNILKAKKINKAKNTLPLNLFITAEPTLKPSFYVDGSEMVQIDKSIFSLENNQSTNYVDIEELINMVKTQYNRTPNTLIMDIEGFEYEIIKNKLEILIRYFKIIIIEYHSEKIFNLIMQGFKNLDCFYEHRTINNTIYNGHFFIRNQTN